MDKESKIKKLKSYIPLVDFISNVAGSNCEVILRDYHEKTSEIIYIVNGEISDREVGDTASGYSLQKIMKADYRENDFVSNYLLLNESNQKVFRSSAYYIKEDEKLIGMICVNYDLTEYLRFRDFYNKAVLYGVEENLVADEYFDESLEEIVQGMTKDVLLKWDRTIPINKVSCEGNPIRSLYQLGVFKYKGSVNKIAEILDISTQTLYHYIKELEDDKETQDK